MDLLDTIAEKVVGIKKVAGVHVQLSAKADVLLSYVELRKEKGVVVQVSAAEHMSLDEFCEKISSEIPLCLSISGKGVLTKKVEAKGEWKDMIDEVLPHANKEEFYFSVQEEGANAFVTLARIELVENVLKEFRQRNFTIAACQLGFSAITSILPFIESSQIDIGYVQLILSEGMVQDFRPGGKGEDNKIGDEKISSYCTLPYAHALQLLISASDNSRTNLHFRGEWQQKELHKKLLTGVLGFFFVLLLSNFFVFSNLSSDNADLTVAIGQNQYQLNRLSQLEKELKVQQELYQTLGVGKQTFFSFYADRLASTIESKSIKLKKIEIQPLVETKHRSLSFEKGKVQVIGRCDNPLDINNWLEKLEKEEWVKQVRNRRYITHPQSGEGEFSFELYVQEVW